MKNLRLYLFILLLAALASPALAQDSDPELTLRLRKRFGFGLGTRIQGSFTLTAQGPDDLLTVDFWIDDQPLASAVPEPFQIGFSTGDYATGSHTLRAEGTTAEGIHLQTEPLIVEFITAESAWLAVRKIIIPLAIGVGALIILGSVIPVLVTRRRAPQPGVYGPAGAAVCPHCRLPFSRHTLSFNLPGGKLERCPHCRKWSIVRRAAAADVAEAEDRLTKGAIGTTLEPEKEAQRLSRLIDESRFEEEG
ncbi:MAG: hypothetical protein PVF70_01405 [Anaerolineales bacterium]|jgi:hypothetical protein